MGILANENAISSGGYQISNSLRFQSASSQNVNRTFGTATSRTTFTLSQWIKRGSLGSFQFFFDGANEDYIGFTPSDTIRVLLNGATIAIETSQVFRDPSAWYHIVFTVDSTQATASNRMKLFINGVQVTAFATTNYPALNATFNFNAATVHRLGTNAAANNYFFDGYMTEVNFIDGQALTPSSFGTTDATSGQWVAKKYTGTYGTNGFYLPFSNGTSTTTLGADSSGNSNNWTLTNFTRSAGTSDCWMLDVPSGNGGPSATQPSSNYAVLNPILQNQWWAAINRGTIQDGNLTITGAGVEGFSNWDLVANSGKWYCEVTAGGTDTSSSITIAALSRTTFETAYYQSGQKQTNGGTPSAYGASWTTNDVIGIAVDVPNNTVTFYKNNVSQGVITNAFPTGSVFIGSYLGVSNTMRYNFGQRSFAYTPPSGFKALCTANLPVATIKQGNKYMDATLYTGNGTTQSIANASSFKPDLVWTKGRSFASTNWLTDSVRGATKILTSNATDAEATNAGSVTSFNAGGFSVGATGDFNSSGQTFVGWQWQAGQGSTSSNTNGSITSTTSVNATAGFSIVTYTGTGANATVGHGLGVAPKMVIVKNRGGTTYSWAVWQSSFAGSQGISLNGTQAVYTDTTVWNSTVPASSVFSVGTSAATNASANTYVAYCFAEIAGFSKFSSFVGNGNADGSFVYVGFKPKFVMIKRSDSTGNWEMFDTSRRPANMNISVLSANSSAAEVNVSTYGIDITSNGFKLRTADATINGSGGTYIYACFAENPFAQSNAV